MEEDDKKEVVKKTTTVNYKPAYFGSDTDYDLLSSLITDDKFYNKHFTDSVFTSNIYSTTSEIKLTTSEYKKMQKQMHDVESTLDKLTNGNEAMQHALIEQDPLNIKYITKPYVSVQLAAISANPKAIDHISTPSQEAIDTYRIVR